MPHAMAQEYHRQAEPAPFAKWEESEAACEEALKKAGFASSHRNKIMAAFDLEYTKSVKVKAWVEESLALHAAAS